MELEFKGLFLSWLLRTNSSAKDGALGKAIVSTTEATFTRGDRPFRTGKFKLQEIQVDYCFTIFILMLHQG